MKRPHLILFMLTSMLFVAACNAPERQKITQTVAASNALLDLKKQYQTVSNDLEQMVDKLPIEEGLALLELQTQTDAFVSDLERYWKINQLGTIRDVDRLYARGRLLYQQGERLLSKNWQHLDAASRKHLSQFAANAHAIDAARQEWLADPNTQSQTEMIKAGIELATLALKIGIAVL